VAARKAANGTVPVSWYKRGQVIAYNAKLGPQAIEWGLLSVAADPTPINWLGAGQLTREFSQFGKEESVDLGRLFERTGALGVDKQYTGREFVEYIQAADPRRLPGEVQKITEQGIASGALSPSDPFVSDALSQAKARIAAGDKASLGALERDAAKAADGKLGDHRGRLSLVWRSGQGRNALQGRSEQGHSRAGGQGSHRDPPGHRAGRPGQVR
jgi:hypothetical protein